MEDKPETKKTEAIRTDKIKDSLLSQIWIKHVLEMFVLTNEVPFICLYIYIYIFFFA